VKAFNRNVTGIFEALNELLILTADVKSCMYSGILKTKNEYISWT
jgi:hypothetical protein